jgi:chitodextrinase
MDRITRIAAVLIWGLALAAIGVGCGTSPPTVPKNVVANAVSSADIDVSWDKSSDFGTVSHYRVYRNGTYHLKIKGTDFRDSGLKSDTEYCYRIMAVDGEDNRSDKSDRACATTFGSGSDTIAPSVPTNVVASVVNSTAIDVSWTASTDNIGVDHYNIYHSGSGGGLVNTSSTNSYADTGLSSGVTYCYVIYAVDAAGNTSAGSAITNSSCATP